MVNLTNLDIAILTFALIVDLLLFIIGIGLSQQIFLFLSGTFGVVALAYFITHYNGIVIGVFTIPLDLILIAWVFLCVLTPFLVLIKRLL